MLRHARSLHPSPGPRVQASWGTPTQVKLSAENGHFLEARQHDPCTPEPVSAEAQELRRP
jgi:hypothetical protein